MTDEIDDDILAAELEDDALEKRMRKLEKDVSQLLDHSNELIREMTKGRAPEASKDGSLKAEEVNGE